MTIYTRPFKPTYLYIKQHTVTGLLYFGQTSKRDPVKYMGSGIHWKRHISLHGKQHVETLWFCLYLDLATIREFALKFSEDNDIVDSEAWANLKPETGHDGGSNGKASADTLKKRKATLANRTTDEKAATYEKWLASQINRPTEKKEAAYKKWLASLNQRTADDNAATYEKWLASLNQRSPEARKAAADRRAATIAKRTPEQKAITAAKIAAKVAARTPEERAQVAAKQMATRVATRLAASKPPTQSS